MSFKNFLCVSSSYKSFSDSLVRMSYLERLLFVAVVLGKLSVLCNDCKNNISWFLLQSIRVIHHFSTLELGSLGSICLVLGMALWNVQGLEDQPHQGLEDHVCIFSTT